MCAHARLTVAACCVLLVASAVGQGPANPTRIPGALPERPTPNGFQPGVEGQVRQQLDYPRWYLLWRNNSLAQAITDLDLGVTLRNASSRSDVVPNQGSANTSFAQYDNGVVPQTARSFLFIRRTRFNNSQVISTYTASSGSQNTYNGTANNTRAISTGSNQATMIARGTIGRPTGVQAPSINFRDGGQRRRLGMAQVMQPGRPSSSTDKAVKDKDASNKADGVARQPMSGLLENLRHGIWLRLRGHRLHGSQQQKQPVPAHLHMGAAWGGPTRVQRPPRPVDFASLSLQQLASLIHARNVPSAEAAVGVTDPEHDKA